MTRLGWLLLALSCGAPPLCPAQQLGAYTAIQKRGDTTLTYYARVDSILRVVPVPPKPIPVPIPVPPKPVPAPDVVRPLAYGVFHLPNDQFCRFTGALRALTAATAKADLAAAKKCGAQLIVSLPGSRGGYTNPDKTFSLALWKQDMDPWKPLAPLLAAYADSGTIIGNYLVDEPHCASCWGGKTISVTDLKAAIAYAKGILPTVPVGIRVHPSWLKSVSASWPTLDFAWAQYEGSKHSPSSGLTPEAFRDKEVAAAQSLGLSLVLGSNTLDGGDGASKIGGTFANATTPAVNRWQMSPAELYRSNRAFLASPACAVLNWRWSPTSGYAAPIAAFDTLKAVRATEDTLATLAKGTMGKTCRRVS